MTNNVLPNNNSRDKRVFIHRRISDGYQKERIIFSLQYVGIKRKTCFKPSYIEVDKIFFRTEACHQKINGSESELRRESKLNKLCKTKEISILLCFDDACVLLVARWSVTWKFLQLLPHSFAIPPHFPFRCIEQW